MKTKLFIKGVFAKISKILLATVMLVGLASCGNSANIKTITKEVNKTQGVYTGKTIILHSNDTHGNIEGFAYMGYYKNYYEEKGATVILVDDGDFTQGEIAVSTSKGANATKIMDEAGYDLVGLGNHELDYGYDQLVSNVTGKNFTVLCSDLFKDGKPVFDSEVIVKVGSLKIGFFGLLTPEAQTKVNPGLIQGLEFVQEKALYEVAQNEIDLLSENADLVICMGHLGVDDESVGNRSYDVLKNTNGIDFFIDGHSHTVMAEGADGQKMQQTGTKFSNIGVIVIDNAAKKVEDNYLLTPAEGNVDQTVYASAKKIVDAVKAEYSVKFATSNVELDGEKPHVRSRETNLGNLITDSMKWSVLKYGSLKVSDDKVVVVTNGGGIRASISVGDVTKEHLKTVLSFGNTVAVLYITGSELLEALEASTFASGEGAFPHIAGINIVVDTSVEYDKCDEKYPKSTYYGPKSIKRVTIKDINGKSFDPNETYAVVTNNFCASGGDTYYAFKRAYDAGNGFDTSIVMDEALQDYITEELGGVINEDYAGAQGRITIK